MITWKMRHEGSPEHTEGLTAQEIVDGVQADFVVELRLHLQDEIGRGCLLRHARFSDALKSNPILSDLI